MCNGITKSGKQCTRKAEWCSQHAPKTSVVVVEPVVIVEPIVEEPVVIVEPIVEEQKNEEAELIEVAVESVQSDIEPTMSPNTPAITQPEPPIVEEQSFAPIKKIFSEFDCFRIHQGDEYRYWIDKCALGKAEVSITLLSHHEYLHDIRECQVLQVVKYAGKRMFRRFVWFWNPVDLCAFVKYFHSESANRDCQFECHEIFLGRDPTIKLFFDIEKVITTEFYNQFDNAGEKICKDVMSALRNTLEMYDHRYETYEDDIDYAIISRTRAVSETETKISFHLITNIGMRVSECKAIVKSLKNDYLGNGLAMSDEYKDLLCDKTTVDTNPYRKNGSLSLLGGRKGEHQLTSIRAFKQKSLDFYLNNTDGCHRYHDFGDELPITNNQSDRETFEESSSEFIKKALDKLTQERVPAYDPNCMDIWANPPRGNYLRVRRTAPSHCPECVRTHDNADTLLLIFNEEKEIALWKCAHSEEMKAKRWFGNHGRKEYDVDDISEDDIEAFAKSLESRAEKVKEATKAKEAERMKNNEAVAALPDWCIKKDKDTIPAVNDIHNPCCYTDYLDLQKSPISAQAAMQYVSKNFALILNGGNSFFLSKNFSNRADGTLVISYQYLKYKNIRDIPGSLMVKVINPETTKEEIHCLAICGMLLHWQSGIAYGEMQFSPYGAKTGYDWSDRKSFNTFTGFVNKYDPDFVVDESTFAGFFKHIREAWCDDDFKLFEFTINLLAYMVQFPHLKSGVAMIVMGPEGLGKNFVMELWRDHVIGNGYFFETPSIDALTGKFNSMLADNLMVVLNEAARVNKSIESNKAQEVMKDIVTEKNRRYERKGQDAFMGECFNNVICFSNNDYVIRASTEMRRFVFYKGSGRFIGMETEHFRPIKQSFVKNDAGKHLYHYLMGLDLAGFHPQRSIPASEIKDNIKLAAIEKPIQWLVACLNQETERTCINLNDSHDEKCFHPSDSMLRTYNAWLEACGERPNATLKIFAKTLAKYFKEAALRKMIHGVRKCGFELSINDMKQMIAKTTRRNDLFDDDE